MKTIVYAHDPLCGWCYGFTDNLAAARDELAGEARFVIGSGGLVHADRRAPLGEWETYIRQGLAAVAAASGTPAMTDRFEKLLRERPDWMYQSAPPIAAIHAATEVDTEAATTFASLMGVALYRDGQAIDDREVVADLACAAGLDQKALLERWLDAERLPATEAWMAEWRGRGLQVYPSLWGDIDGTFTEITRAHVSTAEIVAAVGRVDDDA